MVERQEPLSGAAQRNQRTWASSDVVLRYRRHTELQRPETTIFALLRRELGQLRVLDVGVGAGRTTRHLADAVRDYVGLDYSASMIAVCRREFADRPRVHFHVGDVRELAFAAGSFDLVLVSYNSLDYIDHDGRIRALHEIHRVLATGGYLCLSAHNIRSLSPGRLGLQTLRHPWTSLTRAMRYLQIRVLERQLPDKRHFDHAVVRDLPRLHTYYIKPEAQVRQLNDAGFSDVRAFSLDDGQEVQVEQLARREDKWLYYLCRTAPSIAPARATVPG